MQSLWVQGKVQVIVATVAFGLGVNKADVTFVLHHTLSKSNAGFYQESGRGGRGGGVAESVVLFRPFDVFRLSVIVAMDKNGTDQLYDHAR